MNQRATMTYNVIEITFIIAVGINQQAFTFSQSFIFIGINFIPWAIIIIYLK
jgi:hypothetical protein